MKDFALIEDFVPGSKTNIGFRIGKKGSFVWCPISKSYCLESCAFCHVRDPESRDGGGTYYCLVLCLYPAEGLDIGLIKQG